MFKKFKGILGSNVDDHQFQSMNSQQKIDVLNKFEVDAEVRLRVEKENFDKLNLAVEKLGKLQKEILIKDAQGK